MLPLLSFAQLLGLVLVCGLAFLSWLLQELLMLGVHVVVTWSCRSFLWHYGTSFLLALVHPRMHLRVEVTGSDVSLMLWLGSVQLSML